MSNHTSDSNVVRFVHPEDDHRCKGPNLATYETDLAEFGLTPAECEEFLQALWTLILGFIDLGYGQHPTQHSDVANEINAAILRTVEDRPKKAA